VFLSSHNVIFEEGYPHHTSLTVGEQILLFDMLSKGIIVGFVELGFEDHICKLVHTIYGTMQGAHDWYETLLATYGIPLPEPLLVFNINMWRGNIPLPILTWMMFLGLQHWI